ncbi:acetolactate synthase-1/2/3 large subunit [Tamaricihabitans halophyticus]|uniref:Acetolactate synthase-1/2/3 large subunit n=1 Tax=Tamaricihabitans halophyticus TaxID=1262583 RepID=A0A4R2R3B4_9PSEU|nr:thiamine pyrophosphate-binding protein [Tamaricihabitans halophyticus]TCP53991.1 acetolactate synthase-1/2/3 large subunit [Tamaricihabitans halophyticus]
MSEGRIGGDLVVESLRALGATTVFGIPGQHALGLFDALRRTPELRLIASRVENNAAFAADGYARETGEVAPLVVSTGPGALLTLASLQEARASSVPLLVISSQVPRAGLGGGRHGYLHELPDQQAIAAGVVKSTWVVRDVTQLPTVLREAWSAAAAAPAGPVWVEIPEDVLRAPATLPPVRALPAEVPTLGAQPDALAEAARLLDTARNPVILAGGGVLRAGAREPLRELAEKLRAPVLCTIGGKGAFDWEHPLSGQSWIEDWHSTEFLAAADVLLVVGSGLGELSSNYHTFSPQGTMIQLEADAGKLGANYPVFGLHADAREGLTALAGAVAERKADGVAEAAVAELLGKVRSRLDSQGLGLERRVLGEVRAALPANVPSCWDMTILGYWAWSAWPGQLHSAQGSGGLGYGFPAALGCAVATEGPALAVSGDGGALYGIGELASARQHQLDVTWLIIDDGGYGILREYLDGAFGVTTATELVRPDYVELARSFGVSARETTVDNLRADLAEALAEPGPSVVLLNQRLAMFAATHPQEA